VPTDPNLPEVGREEEAWLAEFKDEPYWSDKPTAKACVLGLANKVDALTRLVLYLADFAEEQGADFGLFYDSEPELFDYPLLRRLRVLASDDRGPVADES
jgi:hypothetical protein